MVMAIIAAMIKPMKPKPDAREWRIPSSMSILAKTLLTRRIFNALTTASAMKKLMIPIKIAKGEISTSPTLKPRKNFLLLCSIISVETPQIPKIVKMPIKTNIGSITKLDQKSILETILRRSLKVLTQKRISSTRCRNSLKALRITSKMPMATTDSRKRLKMKADKRT